MTGAGLVGAVGTDENPEPMDITSLDTGVLWSEDVAALWSDLADQPIARATVWSYLDKSKDADPVTGRKAGRYADDKVPAPAGRKGGRPYWNPEQIPDLTEWWLRREKRGGDRRSSTYRSSRRNRT